jgi:hypothetical protein
MEQEARGISSVEAALRVAAGPTDIKKKAGICPWRLSLEMAADPAHPGRETDRQLTETWSQRGA